MDPMTAERFPIEGGHIMMFARALGDGNPVYHDASLASDSEVGGVIAPPTFVVAVAQYDPDYGMRPKPGERWLGSGRNPTGCTETAAGGQGTGLHAEQHFEYFKPLRPGDVLTPRTSEGTSWAKEGRRGGTLEFHESITDYYNQQAELVVRARSVLVRTQRPVDRQK
jgi:hypothetical protein